MSDAKEQELIEAYSVADREWYEAYRKGDVAARKRDVAARKRDVAARKLYKYRERLAQQGGKVAG